MKLVKEEMIFFFFAAILQKAQGLKKGWGHFILNIKVFGN